MEPAKIAVAAVPVLLALTLLARSIASVSLTCAEADGAIRRRIRYALLPLTGGLAVGGLALGLGPVVTVPATLALLLAVEASAIAFATPPTLERLAEAGDNDSGEPAWWPSFERDFRRPLVQREQNPLQRPARGHGAGLRSIVP